MLKEIKKKLDDELAALDHELKVSLPQEIKAAAALGDLRENAEYKAARERQDLVKSRLSALRNRLVQLSRLDFSSLPTDRIAYGTVVHLEAPDGTETTFRLVMSEETDIPRGWISVSSPIGRGLVGHEAGDDVVVQTPGGVKRWTITKIQTIHEGK